jgi:hypothetical protein
MPVVLTAGTLLDLGELRAHRAHASLGGLGSSMGHDRDARPDRRCCQGMTVRLPVGDVPSPPTMLSPVAAWSALCPGGLPALA